MSKKPLVGISACLLGQRVRYDSADDHQPMMIERLSRYCTLQPFCPEVAIGLGVPREPIELRLINGESRVVQRHDHSVDVTDRLTHYAREVVEQYPMLSGYVFKSRSPSCGIGSARLWQDGCDEPVALTDGRFAKTLQELITGIVVADEVTLGINQNLEQFVTTLQQSGNV